MSQENITNPTTGTNLTSKFLRKAKFRTASASHSEEGEFILGLSKMPDSVQDTNNGTQVLIDDASTTPINQESIKQEPEAESLSEGSNTSPSESYEAESESNVVEEKHIISESNPLPPKWETESPSLSPKREISSPSLSSMLYRRASPDPSTSDVTDSIMSSPRGGSTDTEIIPPEAKEHSPLGTLISFSPEELDQAKNLVLDLLGWGVDPEYLVTTGVSPQMIFRIFTDLNLHLPNNLEVSEELIAAAYSCGPPPELAQSVD